MTSSTTVKAFNGLGKSIANHKKKGDKLIVNGEIRYTRNEKGRADLLQHRNRRRPDRVHLTLHGAALKGRPFH